jgi:YVTN family beta-propeller protein
MNLGHGVCADMSARVGKDSVAVRQLRRDARRAGVALFATALSLIAGSAAANNVTGAWSPTVFSWPLIPLHVVMTPDGRVMSYGTTGDGTQTGLFIYDVWDPSAGTGSSSHMTLPNTTNTDIFCSSQLILPDTGKIFVSGGDRYVSGATTNTANANTNIFDPQSNTLTRANDMKKARWYGSSTALLNGEIYIQGGSSGTANPEVRNLDGTFRLLSNVNTSTLGFQYPRNFVAPDGRIFGYDSEGVMYYVNPAGTGTYSGQGQLPSANRGTSNGSAAMFRPGRILNFGGASKQAVVIDIRNGAPTVTRVGDMFLQRRLVNAAILPNGRVVATGGSRVYNELTDVDNQAEIWNPDTGTWLRGNDPLRPSKPARLYHSISMLLPDATVLVAGGGAPGPQNNLNGEIYYPPYLYDSNGVFINRPTITLTNAQTTLDIGETFNVDFADAASISRVTMVKTGSATHSWNMEQRFVELTFATYGNRLSVQAPTHAADATPGWYLLFALDAAGTPSVARIVRVNIAANPDPAITPVLQNPGDQAGTVGTSASLQLSATDPNGDTLGYAASGLPTGLTINSISGLISGTPTQQGTFNVVVAASDGVNSATRSLIWDIQPGSGPFTLDPPTPPTPSQQGTEATFIASASNGVNTLYQWTFGDGSQPTDWSLNGTATHTYAQPGVYSVTVTASSEGNPSQTQSFLYAVYLPLTASSPAVSSNLVFESGANRVWVVNQDNNSVSVLDGTTLARVAEISVGSAPRSITLTPGGEAWVTNKRDASISVINRGSLAVTRTIALTRASQPFGIAFSPTGGEAWVALEALGQVIKLDASGNKTATLTLSGTPRHVAVTANGERILVSRFISAPVPGENTATLNTGAGGGEVTVLARNPAAIVGQILLRQSDKPDNEIQGRGLPNYLAAAAISPDGSQAWVPSKQDNIARGVGRDGANLDFQNTVRVISSRVNLGSMTEDYPARIDHDNASVASAAVFDKRGVYLFVALETSRQVAVLDAHRAVELLRIAVGRAPQGLAVSADGRRLYVNNFMDRTVSSYDLQPLVEQGRLEIPWLGTAAGPSSEALSPDVFAGKRLFYDAKDPRLARDAYMSCATCHNDGGQDGRVWDLTGFNEGLRNTINLRGRAGAQGFLHWSNNFDEVQDFEGQIRALAGGTGLMSDSDFFAGTRSQPLGTPKTGLSTELDQLAAYVASLNTFDNTPYRSSGGGYTTAANSGRTIFKNLSCASCHGGANFTYSAGNTLSNIGTLKPTSGNRLGQPLTGIDVPTLRDVWATAPYLHDGSAPTLEAAIAAHQNVSVPAADVPKLVSYLQQIGAEAAAEFPVLGLGTGLKGEYFNSPTPGGTPALQRTDLTVNFTWSDSPGAGVNANAFSARWTGQIEIPTTGTYQFRTVTNDGVRLWLDGTLVFDSWTTSGKVTLTTASMQPEKGRRIAVVMEFQDQTSTAIAKLQWLKPASTSFATVPQKYLYPAP